MNMAASAEGDPGDYDRFERIEARAAAAAHQEIVHGPTPTGEDRTVEFSDVLSLLPAEIDKRRKRGRARRVASRRRP
jgi:hypothetical protein